MLKLYVIRHGKAEAFADKDFNRPLAQKGVKQSLFLNSFLSQQVNQNINALYSTALRTTQTYELSFKEVEHSSRASNNFYGADFMQWLEEINSVKSFDPIAIVGHNPGVSRLVSYLSGDSIHMQTGTLIEIEFDLDSWDLIGRETGIVKETIRWKNQD